MNNSVYFKNYIYVFSEDKQYISVLNGATDQLQSRVSPMVQEAKKIATNPTDQVQTGTIASKLHKSHLRNQGYMIYN